MLTAWRFATLLGPLILAISTSITDTYDLSFYISAGIMQVSCSAIPLLVRPPRSPQEKEAEANTRAEAQA